MTHRITLLKLNHMKNCINCLRVGKLAIVHKTLLRIFLVPFYKSILLFSTILIIFYLHTHIYYTSFSSINNK